MKEKIVCLLNETEDGKWEEKKFADIWKVNKKIDIRNIAQLYNHKNVVKCNIILDFISNIQ